MSGATANWAIGVATSWLAEWEPGSPVGRLNAKLSFVLSMPALQCWQESSRVFQHARTIDILQRVKPWNDKQDFDKKYTTGQI